MCSISNRDIKFWKNKDSKTGKVYENNICVPCKQSLRAVTRLKYYKKYRKEQIAAARKWNVENKDKYNARRRNICMQKRLSGEAIYNLLY